MSRPVQTNSGKFRQVHTCPVMFSQTWPEIWALHNLACRSTVQRRKGRQTGNRKCHKESVLPPNISPFWAKPCDHRGQSNKPEHHSLHKKLEKREENCVEKIYDNTMYLSFFPCPFIAPKLFWTRSNCISPVQIVLDNFSLLNFTFGTMFWSFQKNLDW